MFVAETNNGWFIEWLYYITKSLSTVVWLAFQTKANGFQILKMQLQYFKKAGVKIGSLWYDVMPSGFKFFPGPVEFVRYVYLLPLAWGFWLCVVVTETELEEKCTGPCSCTHGNFGQSSESSWNTPILIQGDPSTLVHVSEDIRWYIWHGRSSSYPVCGATRAALSWRVDGSRRQLLPLLNSNVY